MPKATTKVIKNKSKSKSADEPAKQYDLGFKQPVSNNFFAIRERIAKSFRILEIRRFIRSPYTWLLTFAAIALVIVQVHYLLNYYEILPNVIPIYFNAIDLEARLGNKWELAVFPALSGIIVLATTVTGFQLFNSHRELITFSLVNMFVGVSILTLVLLRILAIYL